MNKVFVLALGCGNWNCEVNVATECCITAKKVFYVLIKTS